MIIIVQHRVRDFEAWKPVFDQHKDVRKQHGAIAHVVGRVLDDPSEVVVIMHYPDREHAQAFAADPSLKEAMKQGGVVGEPHITWVDEVEAVDY